MDNSYGAHDAPNAGEIVWGAPPTPYLLILQIAEQTTPSAHCGSRWLDVFARWWSRVVGLLAVLLRIPTQADPEVANAGVADLRPRNVYEPPGDDPFLCGSSLSFSGGCATHGEFSADVLLQKRNE
jgi:hypothetical protein